jgi:hypothetical protein
MKYTCKMCSIGPCELIIPNLTEYDDLDSLCCPFDDLAEWKVQE